MILLYRKMHNFCSGKCFFSRFNLLDNLWVCCNFQIKSKLVIYERLQCYSLILIVGESYQVACLNGLLWHYSWTWLGIKTHERFSAMFSGGIKTQSIDSIQLYTDLWIADHGLTVVGIGAMDFHSHYPTSVYGTRSLCVFFLVLLLWTVCTGASAINSTR